MTATINEPGSQLRIKPAIDVTREVNELWFKNENEIMNRKYSYAKFIYFSLNKYSIYILGLDVSKTDLSDYSLSH